MTDRATETIVVRAPIDKCWEVATDFARYPEWAPAVKGAEIEAKDAQGRPVRVNFRAASFGRSVSYTLDYDYSDAPARLSWKQSAGDLTSRIDGVYEFEALGQNTEVVYHLAVDLKLPVPGFVKRRAEGLIIHGALRDLKSRVESLALTS